MIYETAEMGPTLHTQAPDFMLHDHEGCEQTLMGMMGERGILIGFINDIWKPASIRRILYMQRHMKKFASEGYNVALVIADKQYTLWTFYMSSPMTVYVPLLADSNMAIHEKYSMQHAGLVLIDKSAIIRAKWLMPDELVWPRAKDLLDEVTAN